MPGTIEVADLWQDGNVFSILGKCQRAARKAGWTKEEWSAFHKAAVAAGTYDAVLAAVMTSFDEADEADEADE
jgi:hypothetical protein